MILFSILYILVYINRDTSFILYPVLPVHSFVMTKFPPSTKLLSCNKICAPLSNRFVKAIEPSLIVATMFYYKRIRDTTRTKCVTRKRKRRPRLNCAAMLLILVSRRMQWANAGICNRRRWSKPILLKLFNSSSREGGEKCTRENFPILQIVFSSHRDTSSLRFENPFEKNRRISPYLFLPCFITRNVRGIFQTGEKTQSKKWEETR